MARCGCNGAGDSCGCRIRGEYGVLITGTGGQSDPYVASIDEAFLQQQLATLQGVQVVSGVVDLDNTGSPIREFYTSASATIEGVAFPAGTAVVFRRTPENVWGYKIISDWTALDAVTTTTTTGTTTTTTTAAPAGTLTFRSEQRAQTDVFGDYTVAAADIGPASATRQVIVALSWRASANRDPVLTINGSTPTLDYSAGNGTSGTKFYRMTVAAGTTASIVSNHASSYWPSIAVWTTSAPVTFVAGAGALATASSGATSATQGPISGANGGFALAAYRSNHSTAITNTWTGLTERWDSGTAQPTSGGDVATTGPVTVTATFSAALNADVKLGLASYAWA